MGGLAVVIDRGDPARVRMVESMLALVPHRTRDGTNQGAFGHATMAEVRDRTSGPPEAGITTVGPASIVADMRLWNRGELRSLVGGRDAAAGMSDRRLLLEAYLRNGIGFLDAVDGDFAFVVWDDREQRVIAVRDRFAVKPLYFERTPNGIRFASETKQLVATSRRPAQADVHSMAEFLLDRRPETRRTFFDGVERVRPATALVIDLSGEQEIEYWDPGVVEPSTTPTTEIAAGFRDRLADSVRERIESSDGVVSHLSGGLDSSSISASAHLLVDRDGMDRLRFHTASAAFPGHAIDESAWIDEIAAGQPFPHHDYTPAKEQPTIFEADMWLTDTPLVDRIRGMWSDTARIAVSVGADLVLTGVGGDDILDHYLLLADRLRAGSLQRRWDDLRSHATWRDLRTDQAVISALRLALPDALKRQIGRLPGWRKPERGLLTEDAWASFNDASPTELPVEFGFPSDTQNLTVAASRHPLLVWSNEMQNAEYASCGLDVSHPYLDRSVVEYVASIAPLDRPFDGRGKVMVRDGFADRLPPSVLDRRTKAAADDYLDLLMAEQAPHFVLRYPRVSDAASPFIDPIRYRRTVASLSSGPLDANTREGLWSAWMSMAWLDGLGRYESRRKQTAP